MDLRLYARVLWRFRVLVLGGFVLACLLAFFSYASVSFAGGSPKVSYRQSETWQSTTRLLITQPGFPLGKLSSANATATTPGQNSAPFASPGFLASLAQSYQELGNSDVVAAMLARDHTVHGTMTVAAEYSGQNHAPLPVLDVNGVGPSAADAMRASQRGATVFMKYFQKQQNQNNVAPKNRVQLQVINDASAAQILAGRKKTLPIVIFLAVMIAAVGLAFILENLRPRVHAVPAEEAGEESRLRERVVA